MRGRVHTLDLHYLGTAELIASYLIEGPAGPVLVETGPATATDGLTAGLRAFGLAPTDIRDVLVTHIHLDHAGASGWMARHGARIHVHEFGARHLIDPARLVASARRIYGDRMETLWGELLPVPAAQVSAVHDGDVITAGGLEIRAIETPGHARHHLAFVLETDEGPIAFTGDAAGTFIPEAPGFVALPTPPPEFDLGAWLDTLARLDRERFVRIYPTHFGAVPDPSEHYQQVAQTLHGHTGYIADLLEQGLDRDQVLERYCDWFVGGAEAAGVPSSKIGFYIRDTIAAMNVSGVMRFLL